MTIRTLGGLRRRNGGKRLLAGLLMASTAMAMMPKAEAQQMAGYQDLFENTFRAFEVTGLSSDGSRAAVNGWAGRGLQGMYWDGDTMQGLGGLDRAINSLAMAVSGDGNVIVGSSVDSYVRSRAVRWAVGDSGWTDLGTLRTDNGGTSWANDTNHDGSIVVGRSQSWLNREIGFAWVMGDGDGQSVDGQMYALMPLVNGFGSEARGVSNDGRFAVGSTVMDVNGFAEDRATRWSLAARATGGDPQALANMGGSSAANAVSDDGAVIVGRAEGDDYVHRAVRWVGEDAELHVLDPLFANGWDSEAVAISGDGQVIGGWAFDADSRSFAFRWSEEDGTVYAGDWLIENGVNLGDLRLADIKALSGNGSVIGGTMIDADGEERAYIARVAPPEPGPGPGTGTGVMDVAEYQSTLYSGAAGVANAGEFLTWLPMNGAHHRPLMMTPDLSGDMCAWATGDFASHGWSSTGLALAEAGACVDLAGGSVRLGAAVGTSSSWQSLSLGGSSRLSGQYVLSEVDWQPDGTPLLLSLTGMLGGWQANIDRAYSNGAATAVSSGQTQATGGVIRLRGDWLDAAQLGNTSINPYLSASLGHLHVNDYAESGGPFPAAFDAQNLTHADVRLGVTAVTELSTQTQLSTTFEVAHRSGTAPVATGQVDGLFGFALGGGSYGQTWARVGAELDHKINDQLSLSGSVHLASFGRDPSIAVSAGIKGAF